MDYVYSLSLLFKSLGSVKFLFLKAPKLHLFEQEKTVILWNIVTIYNKSLAFLIYFKM